MGTEPQRGDGIKRRTLLQGAGASLAGLIALGASSRAIDMRGAARVVTGLLLVVISTAVVLRAGA